MLAQAICSSSAYNYTNYYAVLDGKLSKVEQVLENRYNYADYDKNTHILKIEGSLKRVVLEIVGMGRKPYGTVKLLFSLKNIPQVLAKGFQVELGVHYQLL